LRRDRPARRTRRAAALAAACLVALALDADAARLVRVRVGVHPGYARVVLETDAPAPHALSATSTPGEVAVRVAAANAARAPRLREPGAPEVELADASDGATLVTIRSSEPVRVETQVLSAPPRLVVDLRPHAPEDEPELAAEPERPPVEAAEAAPADSRLAPEEALVEEAAPPDAPLVAEPDEEPLVMPAVERPVEIAAPAPPGPAVEPPPAATEIAQAAEPPVPALEPIAAPPPVAPPAVSAPAPAPPELRTIATALAALVAALFAASALLRRRGAAPEAAGAAVAPVEPTAGVAAAAPAEPLAAPEPVLAEAAMPAAEASAAPPLEEATMNDFVRMQARVDARLGEVLERLDEIAARLARLESRGGHQEEELRSQRVAIARLQRATAAATAPLRASLREEGPSPPRRPS
jgi:hypothetical protein